MASSEVDDLVQEIAARLLSVWHKFDRSKPVWPLTATIALNLLRDRSRKHEMEFPGELPEVPTSFDAAQIGLARMELTMVLRAMEQLTPSQRAALLRAIHQPADALPSTSSEKMLRMRARKRLANAVGRASAGLCLRLRRTGDLFQAFIAKGDVVQALACATCLFVTTAGAVTLYPPAGTTAAAETTPKASFATSLMSGPVGEVTVGTGGPTQDFLTRGRTVVPDAGATDSLGAPGGRETLSGARQDGDSGPEASDEAPLRVDSAALPGNAPVPAPDAPDAPSAPPQPPTVAEAPAPEDNSPVQAPTGDGPVEIVDEATETLNEVTN